MLGMKSGIFSAGMQERKAAMLADSNKKVGKLLAEIEKALSLQSPKKP